MPRVQGPHTCEQQARILGLEGAAQDGVAGQGGQDRLHRGDGHLGAGRQVPPEQRETAQGLVVELLGQRRIGHVTQDEAEALARERRDQLADAVTLGQAGGQGPGPGAQGFEVLRQRWLAGAGRRGRYARVVLRERG